VKSVSYVESSEVSGAQAGAPSSSTARQEPCRVIVALRAVQQCATPCGHHMKKSSKSVMGGVGGRHLLHDSVDCSVPCILLKPARRWQSARIGHAVCCVTCGHLLVTQATKAERQAQ